MHPSDQELFELKIQRKYMITPIVSNNLNLLHFVNL